MATTEDDRPLVDAAEAAFIGRLCVAFPTLRALREEHERDVGELLPYLFLGDVTRHAVALHGRGTPHAREELASLCRFLEREYVAGSERVRTLIALGFLENLAGPPDPQWRVREALGPALRREIETIWPSGDAR